MLPLKENRVFIAVFFVSIFAFYLWGSYYVKGHHLVLFALASLFGWFMAFNIGGNDVANSFGTSVGAKTLTIRQALLIAAVFELSGAVFAGEEVTKTIRSGIVVFPEHFSPMLFVGIMLSSLLASSLWIFAATQKGLPVSTTHSIVGGIVGASLMMGLFLSHSTAEVWAMVNWQGLVSIVISWVISPVLGGVAAYCIFAYIHRAVLLPSRLSNRQIKQLKKEKRAFKKAFFNDIHQLSQEQQIKILSHVILDDREENEQSVYRKKMAFFRQKEKEIDLYAKARKHVPIIGCLGAMIIAGMLLFKGAKNINSLGLMQNLWVILITGVLSYTLTYAVIVIVKKTQLKKTMERIFSWFQIFTACAFAFSHGANDMANALGPFAGILDVFHSGKINPSAQVPSIVTLMFGIALVLGLWCLGKEVIETVGSKLASIRPTTGFSAELGASVVILLATQLGIPVSSTHILIGAVLGIGLYNRNAKWQMVKPIVLAWMITLPVAAFLSAAIFMLLKCALGL